MGYSINLLTLLALVLAIGLVVDDAIIVVENVQRHMEEGKPALEAAIIRCTRISGSHYCNHSRINCRLCTYWIYGRINWCIIY